MLALGQKHSETRKQCVTWSAMALLVIVQLLATAHFHPPVGAKTSVQSSSSFADPDLCPICLHQCHTPSVLAAMPAIGYALANVRVRSLARRAIALLPFDSPLFGRAPPSVLL